MTTLTLVRMQPDLLCLARWVRQSGQGRLVQDTGYALHAALRATFGALAPQPFCLRERDGVDELLGYTAADASTLDATLSAGQPIDLLASDALGLRTLAKRPMPADWCTGERFSFEARVVPVVRSRAVVAGRVVEIDAARHAPFAEAGTQHSAGAYGAWLAVELARNGAAQLLGCTVQALRHHRALRREHASEGPRRSAVAWVPDLTVRGLLRVADGEAFSRLLARGLGRHRAFGFGCILLAPPGAMDEST